MVIRRVSQRGGSLVELMVASLLGLLVLAMIGSLMISMQRMLTERGLRLLLAQNLSSAIQQMKEDAQRGGYNGIEASSLMLSGADAVLHVESDPALLGYVYRVASSGNEAFRHVVYRLEEGKLKLCEKDQPDILTVVSAAVSGYQGVCFSLFEPAQIRVTAFRPTTQVLISNATRSGFTSITLEAQLAAKPAVSQAVSVALKHRNWQ